MYARLARTYRTQYADPIRLRAGETVALGREDTEWPGWIWATDAEGRAGWAPLALFERDAERAAGRVREHYTARELDADEGAVVRLHRELAGWWWSETNDARCGWLPARDLILEETNR